MVSTALLLTQLDLQLLGLALLKQGFRTFVDCRETAWDTVSWAVNELAVADVEGEKTVADEVFWALGSGLA